MTGDFVGVTSGTGVAGTWSGTFVFQVAKKSCLARRTRTLVPSNFIMTSSTILTRKQFTIVAVDITIASLKAVDTDALVASFSVLAGAVVLARVQSGTLVNILSTVWTGPLSWALARISAHSVLANGTILAKMSGTVIYIVLAVTTAKTHRAGALIVISSNGAASSTIFTGARITGNIWCITILTSPPFVAGALVSTVSVHTSSVTTRISMSP